MRKHKINFDKGSEWALLESICITGNKVVCDPSTEAIVRNRKINWGEVIEQSMLHKMLPTLAERMVSQFYTSSVHIKYDCMPNFIGGYFRQALLTNIQKIKVFRKAMLPILEAFKNRNIPIVSTKGFVFENTLHGANGSRNFNTDVDFMILPKNMNDAEEIMKDLGIAQGYYDYNTNSILPHSRKDILTYKMSPDHLAPFCVITGDPIIKFVYVDFASSFTWINSPYEISIKDALAKKEKIEIDHEDFKIIVPKFDLAYEFIFTILHLFREAWIERWVNIQQDVNLMKFFDVIQLYYSNEDYFSSDLFRDLLDKYDINRPVYWVLEHMDRTFSTDAVKRMKLQKYSDEDFLFSANGNLSGPKEWYGSMRDRLHTKDRTSCFKK